MSDHFLLNPISLAIYAIIMSYSVVYIFLSILFNKHMKSFVAKRLKSILVKLRYLRFKLLKYKENIKKMCNTFDHNFKNISLYIMRKVSYFVLYDCALTSKISKMALFKSRFAIKLFISILGRVSAFFCQLIGNFVCGYVAMRWDPAESDLRSIEN